MQLFVEIGLAAAGLIAALVGYIVGKYDKRLEKLESRQEVIDDKSNEIVSNYLVRFDEIKTMLSELRVESHDMIHEMTVENNRSHADIIEMFNFVRAKINSLGISQ